MAGFGLGKKAAGSVVSQMILFIAVVSIATGLVFSIKSYSDDAESSLNTQSDAYNRQIRTNIDIEVIHYDNTSNVTTIYVRNTGAEKIDAEKVDVWIDGVRFPRNETYRNITVEADTDLIETGIWNSKELVRIDARRDLDKDTVHDVIVMTPNSVRSTDSFSI